MTTTNRQNFASAPMPARCDKAQAKGTLPLYSVNERDRDNLGCRVVDPKMRIRTNPLIRRKRRWAHVYLSFFIMVS
jgi:hypothetical protein